MSMENVARKLEIPYTITRDGYTGYLHPSSDMCSGDECIPHYMFPGGLALGDRKVNAKKFSDACFSEWQKKESS